MESVEHYEKAVTGIAAGAYVELGEGSLESVCENAMAIEFRRRNVPYAIENNVEVLCRGECVGIQRLDFMVGGALAVELKATGSTTRSHLSQTRAYMRTADFAEALIVNFPSPLKDKPDVRVVRKGAGA